MSLIHEALKKAAHQEAPEEVPKGPLKLHVQNGTLPVNRLVRTAILSGLLVTAGLFVYWNVLPRTPPGPTPSETLLIPGNGSPVVQAGPKTAAPKAAEERMNPVAGTAQVKNQLREESKDSDLETASRYIAAGRYPEAEWVYRKALSQFPQNAMLHNNLARVLRDLGRTEEAESEYRAALRINPSFVPALNNLGLLYDRQNRIDRAFQFYQEALRLDPHFAEAHLNYASALERSGYGTEALDHYKAFLAYASKDDQKAVSLVKKHLKNRF